jgi:dipeptidyl-peptidase-4
MTTPPISFPRQLARTQRFSLGVPREFAIAPDGSRIAFLRSQSGTDPVTCLWVRDTGSGAERLVVDPQVLLAGQAETLTPEERARRERTRQGGRGVVAFATDDAVRIAVFALSGRLFVADLTDLTDLADGTGGAVRELPAAGPVLDPHPDPTGARVAYVTGGALHVIGIDGTGDQSLATPEAQNVTYGLAEFVAAEEMYRTRGFWWSPDGQRLLVARVDTTPVMRWHISDPANPERPPTVVAYPQAGTANAIVSVVLADLDGGHTAVAWDAADSPYLISAHWSAAGPALLRVSSRDQQTMRVLAVADDGSVAVVAQDTDPDWVDVVPGTPAWTSSGELVRVAVRDGAYRLLIGDTPVTGPELNVRQVLDVGDDVLVSAHVADPAQLHVYAASRAGVTRVSPEPGVHQATRGGDLTVLTSRSLDWSGPRVRVHQSGEPAAEIPSLADTPVLTPEVTFFEAGPHRLPCALVLPRGHVPGSARLPVLCDPYGGPAAQMVVASRNAYLSSQWFADQGFAVLIADGRGTPGRGPEWDRSIHYDEATPNVEDQVAALEAAAAANPDLDLSRVGIRGWSHGGYLAALAVLRRPDVFHAGVAGAPVTDLRLYDTFYNERYLGHPDEHPEAYEHNSIIADAPKLERPLMLIHGLADDNVVVAHTLRMSSALLAAGRPHTVLPLSGVTHMASQEEVAENLLLLQVDFLHRALASQD